MKLWTVATDTDNGLNTRLVTSEVAAYTAVGFHFLEGDDRVQYLALLEGEDGIKEAKKFMQSWFDRTGSVDSYSVERHVLPVPDDVQLELLKEWFPWLGTDEDQSGAEAIDTLVRWHEEVGGEFTGDDDEDEDDEYDEDDEEEDA